MKLRQDLALLVLRIFSGFIIMQFGLAKVVGGKYLMARIGSSMKIFGLGSGFIFWGWAATLSELVGGSLLMVGFCTRLASAFLFFTMLVATLLSLKLGTYFAGVALPLEMAGAFLALMFSGPGRFSLDGK
jgi:putative oxidoreductase